jgi:hypothetical protein
VINAARATREARPKRQVSEEDAVLNLVRAIYSGVPRNVVLPNVPLDLWLYAKEIAAQFNVNEDTVIRWWQQGLPGGTNTMSGKVFHFA